MRFRRVLLLQFAYSVCGVLGFAAVSFGQDATGALPVAAPVRAYIHGKWYDGKGFREGTFYVVNGTLTRRKPAAVSETINLQGRYVIPPLADAHCHHFDNEFMVKQLTPTYLNAGIFYAQSMCNWVRGRDAVKKFVNRPDGVDVAYANAALTSRLGHPFSVYEGLASPAPAGMTYEANLERLRDNRNAEGQAYFFAETPELLAEIWPRLLATKPDLIKIMLLESDRFLEKRMRNVPGDNGLPAAIVPEIVRRAHAAGLKVYAHVETAYDFHVGVTSGIDGFAHLPGYAMGKRTPDAYLLNEADVEEFGRRGGVVQPTAWLAKNYAGDDVAALKRVQEVQKRNLALLKKYHVRIAIGSDWYGRDCREEAEYLSNLGVFTPAELLKIWCETTPQTIFPQRKTGRLAEGYEASFLVLSADPRADLKRLKDITMRVKQGTLLP